MVILCASAMPVRADDSIRRYEVRENDSISYTLNLVLDKAGQPLYFFRNIYTPVCNTGECKPVYINFYWDLRGNYTRFDMPDNEVLTKTDHREFQEKDYAKLQDILSRETSILAELKMEDLVVKGTEDISDSANIKTGATLKTIKNDVIEGAVFTCYTLWHLAHGPVKEEIRKITETYLSPGLLHRFLNSDNYHYQYFAMEKVISAEGHVQASYEGDIEKIIAGKNIFTARHALQTVNRDFFDTPSRQLWLWEVYNSAVYPFQMAILKKLKDIPLGEVLAVRIAKAVRAGNHEQFKIKLALLAAQQKLSDKAQLELAEQLTDPDAGEAIYEALSSLKPTHKTVRKKLSGYEKAASSSASE
ncbi:hypothetical protein [Chitinophaga sp. XS-30]|uniref:hypothetical protein n=1 Tax=Chitinophaga sp. XS-30 TaxID=2604421 RepID=UPI0011DE2647|nr:hypothetical protein [Chitinophaga sp. XS-30]QEH39595.1 hypothetical protein FW415_01405 [Chitinophaga sp. XS-30]